MRRFLLALFVALLLVAPRPAQADVAPPANPPGVNPAPGEEATQVRMEAETVLIEVLPARAGETLGRARVTADFTMRNLGTASETMAARFPISANDGFYNYPEISDIVIQVNGLSVPTRRTTGPDPQYASDTVAWAEFDVTFPASEVVSIRVSYTLEATGEYPYAAYYYILHTGAGWQGTIGRAELILRLPYEANEQNVIFSEIGWGATTQGGAVAGREIRWVLEDFEPEWEDNLRIALVAPGVWEQVLAERARVAANPGDGEAWGRLGKLYKESFLLRRGYREDAGGGELYSLGVAAYEQAVTLLPEDALWHAGFAELLAYRAIFGAYTGEDVTPGLVRALEEIHTALTLRPNDPVVRQIADDFLYYLLYDELFANALVETDAGYEFLWLMATPTALASMTPEPAAPSETPAASATAMATTVPDGAPAAGEPSSGGLPLCGAVLLPLAFLFGRRRPRKAASRVGDILAKG